MQKIIGVQSVTEDKQSVITVEEVKALQQQALANIAKLDSKPTLQDLYKSVDDIWNKGLTKQLIFANKDQHYEYITRIYKEQIEPLSVEAYKKMLTAQTMRQFDSLLSALDRQKQAKVFEQNKQIHEKTLHALEEAGEELVEKNKAVRSELKDKIAEVSSAFGGGQDAKDHKHN